MLCKKKKKKRVRSLELGLCFEVGHNFGWVTGSGVVDWTLMSLLNLWAMS